ncbi:hypothetical protein T09_7533 [Trichinella sp. T9]|nr:hypothetical protein T09_7533 [Trichinella sp. T9]
MSSLSQLSSTGKQVDEDSTKQFIMQLIINVEEHILLHHVNKLLALPMIQNIIQIPTPEPSGQIKKGFAETCYSTAGLPYNMAGRIIGPRGCTVKAIQLLCGCGIELNFIKYNLLLIQIFVEPDYESIVKFKIWKAFQLIYCLLRMDPSGKSDEDMVNAIQLKDLKFYATRAEMLKVHFPVNLTGADLLNAQLNEKNSFNTVGIVDMFEKLEENILLYHMKNLLTLTRLQNILHFPPPVQFGKIKNGFATKIYSSLHYPFDVAKRIIGPNNLTAKAIQNICECRIQLLHEKNNTIKVMVFAENDYDSILMFKLWKTLQCINCLLEIHPFGKDFVGEIQQADSQFWERQMEIIFNSLPIISSLPVSQYDSTFTVSSENLKRTC